MSKTNKFREKIPDLLREQIHLDEVEPRLWQDRALPSLDNNEQLEHSDRQILSEMPPRTFAKRVVEKAHLSPSKADEHAGDRKTIKFPHMLTASATAAVFAALAGFLLFGPLRQHAPPFDGNDVIRLKGEEHGIQLYLQQEDGASVQVSPGLTADAGTELQLAYRSMRAQFGVIASVDGVGYVTLHYPESMFDVPRLHTGSQQLLPYAFKLDNAPSHEEFVFIVSESTFSVREALQWISNNLDQNNRILPDEQPVFADGLVRFLINKE